MSKIRETFAPLQNHIEQLTAALAKYLTPGKRRSGITTRPLSIRKRGRRRKNKAARRARRYNRRPTKRPKGRRKP